MAATVLVVDDSGLVRQQVSRALVQAGFHVLEAKDGRDALTRLAECPAAALVICDVNMPTMDGMEFLGELRAQGAAVPVVMLTTEGQPELMRRAKELGAKGWLVKPFKPEMLVAVVKKMTAVA